MKTLKPIALVGALYILLSNAYSQVSPTTGLLAYYPLNGNASDEGGSGYDGQLVGPMPTSDRFGHEDSALLFDGANDYAELPVPGLPTSTQPRTLSAWIRADTVGARSHNEHFVGYGLTGASFKLKAFGIALGSNPGAGNNGRIYGFFGYDDTYTSSFAKAGEWTFVAHTYDGQISRVYVNGTLSGQETTAALTDGTIPLSLGARYTTEAPAGYRDHFKGAIDDLRFYNRVLSPNDISQLYRRESYPYEVIADNFSSENLDIGRWEVRRSFSDSDAFAQSGNLVLVNRGKVLMAGTTTSNILINTRLRFTGSQHDVFRIVWRSTGEDRNIQNSSRELLNGIRLSLQQANSGNGRAGSVTLDWIDHPTSGGVIGAFKTNLLSNVYYTLRVEDTGSQVKVYLGSNSVPIIVGSFPSRFGNRIALYNREGIGGGSSISAGSRVEIDNIRVEGRECIPHKATAEVVVENGQVVGALITDGGCGYAEAPLILIQGGGGSGALARATVIDGEVTSIDMISGGIGYSSNPAPRLVIASPPFAPSLSIRFTGVEVVQTLMLGKTYVLEASFDLDQWNATGAPFRATSEIHTNEFRVENTGTFFRLRQVP